MKLLNKLEHFNEKYIEPIMDFVFMVFITSAMVLIMKYIIYEITR